jgi:hypothetical protein
MQETKKVYQINFSLEKEDYSHETIYGNLYENELHAYKYAHNIGVRMGYYKQTMIDLLRELGKELDISRRQSLHEHLLSIECPVPDLAISENDIYLMHYPFNRINVSEIDMICN